MLQRMIKQTEKVKETKKNKYEKKKTTTTTKKEFAKQQLLLKIFFMSLVNFPFSFFAF